MLVLGDNFLHHQRFLASDDFFFINFMVYGEKKKEHDIKIARRTRERITKKEQFACLLFLILRFTGKEKGRNESKNTGKRER